MKRLRRLLAIAMVLALSLGILPIAEAVESTSDQTYSHIDYVNPYIGTAYDAAIHSWGQSDYGGTVPSVAPPFGMTKWTPQTRRNSIGTAAYRYDDQYITGFQATHQPAIWMGDFGYLTIMPGVDSVKTSTNDRRLSFTHVDVRSSRSRWDNRSGKEVVVSGWPGYQEASVDNIPSSAHKEGVAWALENGILRGNADGDLMLSQPVTVQKLCTMMKRLAKHLGKD